MELTEGEPTQGNPAPGERRARKSRPRGRRWLIVALVLVLVMGSTGAWWYWPRGDARFVGKWELQHDGAAGGGMSVELELRSNGIAVFRPVTQIGSSPPPIKSQTFARWTFDGDYLTVGNPGNPPAKSYLNSFARLLQRQLGIDLMTDRGDRYLVGSISTNEIYIALPIGDYFDQFKLVRIPE